MKTTPECFPCFFQQILRAARLAGLAEGTTRDIMQEFCRAAAGARNAATPSEVGADAYRIFSRITGIGDPYKDIKAETVRKALALYPRLKERVSSSQDRLLAALKVAVAGNVIDFGIGADLDLDGQVESSLGQELAIDHSADFRKAYEEASGLLYIADNAGETVFDRVLIEELAKPVLYAVREAPIINDATAEDAETSGIDRVARIVSTGCAMPGTILEFCSAKFVDIFRRAELVISKGQGNYEGLSDERAPVFFLLKAKCDPVARDLGVGLGSTVLMKSPFYPG